MVEPVAARQLKDRNLYRQRAEEARSEASEATLDNVRDRCLRAEAAWIAMADRAERAEKRRADDLEAKEAAKLSEATLAG
jgi:hypothetical protein